MTEDERRAVRLISNEFIHYKSASVAGFKEYQSQIIERQARSYEVERKKYYRNHLAAMVAAYLKHRSERRVVTSERERYANNQVVST